MKRMMGFLVIVSMLVFCVGITAKAVTDYHYVMVNSYTTMSATATSDTFSWGASIACYGDPVNVTGYIKVGGSLKWDGYNAPALLDDNTLSYNGIGINKKVEVKAVAPGNISVEASAN